MYLRAYVSIRLSSCTRVRTAEKEAAHLLSWKEVPERRRASHTQGRLGQSAVLLFSSDLKTSPQILGDFELLRENLLHGSLIGEGSRESEFLFETFGNLARQQKGGDSRELLVCLGLLLFDCRAVATAKPSAELTDTPRPCTQE